MRNLMTVKNVRGYIDEKGIAFLNIEDVARGLGFTRIANSGNEVVMWSRVKGYLNDLSYTLVCTNDFIPENIFYKLCMKANNETARAFQDLVCDEILPTIRKTGGYILPDKNIISEEKKKRLEIMEKNANVRMSKQFTKLAELTKDLRYKEVLISLGTNIMTKEDVLPLPRLEQKSYTAEEIGKIIGISSNMVGRIANEHKLKNEKYGYLAQDKAKYCNKSVESFRYYEHAIDEFKKILNKEVQ